MGLVSNRRMHLLGMLGTLAFMTSYAQAAPIPTYIDLSSYANNNIFTDLNENFPNTGPGTPGSHTGTANSQYLFDPATYAPQSDSNVSYSSYTDGPNNGVSFQLRSNATGQDFAQIGTSGPTGYTGPNPLIVSIGVDHVTAVYALMASYTTTSFSVTFTGADSSTETFSSIPAHDFYSGPTADTLNCSAAGTHCDQTAFTVNSAHGGGGTGNATTGSAGDYSLTEYQFNLDSTLSNEELTSATFNSAGYETLLFGLTTQSPAPSTPVPEPASLFLLGSALVSLGFFTVCRGVGPAD